MASRTAIITTVATVVTAIAAPAFADDAAPRVTATAPVAPARYVALTGSVATDQFVSADLGAEVGARIATRIWGHASLRTGGAIDAEGGGGHTELRLGFDYQRCTARGGLCGLAGIDLGYQLSGWQNDEGSESHGGLLVAPHVGLDTGGAHLRFRLIAEVRGFADGASSSRIEPGVGVSAAMAYRF